AEAVLVARGVEVFRLPATGSQESGVRSQKGGATRLLLTPESRLPIPAPPPRPSPTSGEAETAVPYPNALSAAGDSLDIVAVLRLLAGRGITRLMVEGGPTVAAAFLVADLVDEAALLRSHTPIGQDGIDALEAMPLTALTTSA